MSSSAAGLYDASESSLHQILQPLQMHMLPQLRAQHIAALRSTCTVGRQLIDSATVHQLQPAASSALRPACIEHATDSLSLQSFLRAQACILRQIVTAEPALVYTSSMSVSKAHQSSVPRMRDWQDGVIWVSAWPRSHIMSHELLLGFSLVHVLHKTPQPARYCSAGMSCLDPIAWCTHQQMLVCKTSESCLALLDPMDSARARASKECNRPSRDLWLPASCNMHGHARLSAIGDHIIVGEPGPKLAVCHLPGLQPAWHLLDPSLESSTSIDESWLAWSPTGSHLAMLVRETHDADHGEHTVYVNRLKICASVDGTETVSFTSWDKAWGRGSLNMRLVQSAWDPTGSRMAMWHSPINDTDAMHSCVIIVNLDGSWGTIEAGGPGSHPDVAAWSSCGRFLHVNSRHLAGHWDSFRLYNKRVWGGGVWDVITNTCIYRWDKMVTKMNLIWAPSACTFFAWDKDVSVLAFMSLCESGKKPEVVVPSIERHGLMSARNKDAAFSPCGRLLVFVTRAYLPAEGDNYDLSEREMLWHLDCSHHGQCSLQHVIDVPLEDHIFLPELVAWHPFLRRSPLYAIPSSDGAVHIFDGSSNERLRSWDLELSLWPDGTHQLAWSPDGMSLAVTMHGHGLILDFE